LYNWLDAFTLVLVAGVGTTLWSLVARKREHHVRLFAWFRLILRFALGTTFLAYGWSKVVPLQMPPGQLTKLVEPFGNFSPMGVLWWSIGASPPYEMFVGLAEVTAGMLLFVPATAQLGAMMGLMDAIAIFTLNMTYDVPVKLFAFHLILMSIALAAPNARRVFELFVLHRTTTIAREPTVGRTSRARRGWLVAQVAFGVYACALAAYGAKRSWTQFGGGSPR
ncbi:MAG: DoxX family protein, partial [Gemmatimonadaceae bacterium]